MRKKIFLPAALLAIVIALTIWLRPASKLEESLKQSEVVHSPVDGNTWAVDSSDTPDTSAIVPERVPTPPATTEQTTPGSHPADDPNYHPAQDIIRDMETPLLAELDQRGFSKEEQQYIMTRLRHYAASEHPSDALEEAVSDAIRELQLDSDRSLSLEEAVIASLSTDTKTY